jgi:hypothetical protein
MLTTKRSILLVTLIFLSWFSAAGAFWGTESDGTTGASFLKIGVGARAVGMGGAFVAVSDDATSSYWNPAGLCQLRQQEITFTHNEWLQDVKYEYLGYGFPLGKRSSLGFGFIYLHMGTIPGYDREGNSASAFKAYDSAILLSLSQKLKQNLSLGIGFKWIKEQLEQEGSQSFAFDMGCLWSLNNFSAGLVVNNLGTPVKFVQEEFILPSKISLGLSYRTLSNRLTLAGDIDFPNDGGPILKQGIEYCYQGSLFLRGGYQYRTDQGIKEKTELSLGGGLRIFDCDLNYTYSPDYGVGNVHYFSVSYRFGSKR